MSLTLKLPMQAPERPAPAKAEPPARREAAQREEGSRFKDELREARREEGTRSRSPENDRPESVDTPPGLVEEKSFRHPLPILGLGEEGPIAADQPAPGEGMPQPPAAPAANPAEPQMVTLDDAEALPRTTAKPIAASEAARLLQPKPQAGAGEIALPQQAEPDAARMNEAAGDAELLAEQSLKGTSVEAQAKAPPPSARAMPAAVPLDQVAVHIATSAANGVDRIQIQLTPASLGRIDVEMEVAHDGRVDAVVRVDKPETMELLQRDARQLVRALQDAGLQADSGSLSFELRDQGGRQEERPTRAAGRSRSELPGVGSTESAAVADIQMRRVRLGGLDIIA